MFPMPNKQKSFETTDSSSSKSFAEPSIIKTEQELQQEIKAKTKELLSGFGGTEDGFSEKESAEQDKMVSDLFKTESVYSKTLAELKSQILSVISDKAL